jgi:hypothetical protein
MVMDHSTQCQVKAQRSGLVAAGLAALALVAGCLGEPEIDERWTLVEMLASSPGPAANVAAGQAVDVTVSGRITYRDIETGFLVAEARYADALDRRGLVFADGKQTLESALSVERILDNSVTVGRATRPVTGFDHLMQTVDLEFSAQVPAAMASGPADSADFRGLYLVLYLGEGEEVELQNGRDSLLVTPFRVEETQVLFSGHLLNVDTGGGGP